jgi:hypothetical protein
MWRSLQQFRVRRPNLDISARKFRAEDYQIPLRRLRPEIVLENADRRFLINACRFPVRRPSQRNKTRPLTIDGGET